MRKFMVLNFLSPASALGAFAQPHSRFGHGENDIRRRTGETENEF